MSTKPIISEKVSKHLFLSNLLEKNLYREIKYLSKDNNIDNLILSLKSDIENKKTYLDSLEHKLNFIRNTDITKEIEEKKTKN